MKTIKKVNFEAVFVEDFLPDELEENKVYISEKYGATVHNCLCGCGNKTYLPIDNVIDGVDYGWTLIKHPNDKVSFTPSVGNFQLPCKSHYIMTKNVANFV